MLLFKGAFHQARTHDLQVFRQRSDTLSHRGLQVSALSLGLEDVKLLTLIIWSCLTHIMDLDSIEALNEIRPSVYRAAMKLLELQRLHVVSVSQIGPALLSEVGGAPGQEVGLSREEVMRTLNRMFHSVSQEVPGHVTLEAPERTCSVLYQLYDRGSRDRGTVSRSRLRSLLQDLSQVPAAVQEECVFGGVEAAVKSCFNGVLTPSVSQEHVLSWLQSEPRLLLWLPTLYRLSVSRSVSHAVRCRACNTFPITGLRYRCMKCVNLHLCQSCFLTCRQTKKHKTHHPVVEHCTQPTWREALTSLARSARHALLPRRYTKKETDRRKGLMWAEPEETEDSSPPDAATRLAASAVRHDASCSASPRPAAGTSHDASLSRLQSKALQTEEEEEEEEEEAPTQQVRAAALLDEVRNLHRDKWLMEQELQAWRVAVQSEQGMLEDRCSEMEVTMETLRQHNVQLQGMLTQSAVRRLPVRELGGGGGGGGGGGACG
ncbi:dystrotelin [Myripristis murdjan]|uniref:dystrotelin n=1 Tax=Myripristis murdjan TaxID=586833 RepID=UPI001176455B|nr:dystrotelin [Myripristis murdjan]